MSDTDSETEQKTIKLPVEAVKPRKPVSEKQRLASTANIAKARAARSAKKIERLKAEDEDKIILKAIVEERKKPKKEVKKVVKPESSESEASESEASESSDSDSEFVLTKTASKKTKEKAPKKTKARSSLLAEVEALRAEMKALQYGGDQKAPVNVYFNQPEPRKSTLTKQQINDL